MTSWRARLTFAAVLLAAIQVHGFATESLTNTPDGMFVFHVSAACVDLFLLYGAPKFLFGRLCDDMQTFCFVSIVVNFLGWLAYLAYAPPIYYNVFMWGLSYVQWARLLLVDSHDANYLGINLVRSANNRRGKFNVGEAYQ